MQRNPSGLLGCLLVLVLAPSPRPASGAEPDEATRAALQAQRSEIEAMKRDYEARLRALEERARDAERRAGEPRAAAQAGPGESGSVGAPPAAAGGPAEGSGMGASVSGAFTRLATAFNPRVSAVLQGRLAYLQGGDGGRRIPGFPLGAETDRGPEGLALGESELVFSANVDDKLYGFFDVSFDQDEIGIEEAFLSTLSLPFGLGLKAGQFLSAIGYHNARHSHTWDFIDAPLVYEAMLDESLSDPGVQITWIAPTDLYVELGAEVLRGDAFPAAGAANSGFGSATVFAKLSGDLGDSHSWKTGVSYLRSESVGRESEGADGSTVLFEGTSDLVIADLVWKWAPLGNFRERNFTLQAEYMHRHEKGDLTSGAAAGPYGGDQDGFYIQGVYQFMPRWRVGLRYGQLWGDNRSMGLPPNVLDADGPSPHRVSTMIDFSNSEFSRLRLQYSFASGGLGDDSMVYLQYIISIGSHGAHTF